MSIEKIIKQRRSIDPDHYNGKPVAKEIIEKMLEAANWAPTHGLTEPWRFVVYSGEQVPAFGAMHADIYKQFTPAEQFLQKKYDKISNRSMHCSHVIVCAMHPGNKKNIPELEEIAATACAIQNMLLVATEYHIGTFWSTGGMCYHPEMKKNIGFEDTDQILAILYIGHYDIDTPNGIRPSGWEDKVIWK
ncbi:MAG: hypothetical protein RJA25_1559 [Bacteroidota bacterium]|jgi:nitroreductase